MLCQQHKTMNLSSRSRKQKAKNKRTLQKIDKTKHEMNSTYTASETNMLISQHDKNVTYIKLKAEIDH